MKKIVFNSEDIDKKSNLNIENINIESKIEVLNTFELNRIRGGGDGEEEDDDGNTTWT